MIDYPIVNFTARMNNSIAVKIDGLLIEEKLIAGGSDTRFRTYTLYNEYGYKTTNLTFKTLEDSVKFALLFNQLYKDYFDLWEDDKRARIPELTQWTIDNGIIVVDTINSLAGNEITFEQFLEAYHARLDS